MQIEVDFIGAERDLNDKKEYYVRLCRKNNEPSKWLWLEKDHFILVNENTEKEIIEERGKKKGRKKNRSAKQTEDFQHVNINEHDDLYAIYFKKSLDGSLKEIPDKDPNKNLLKITNIIDFTITKGVILWNIEEEGAIHPKKIRHSELKKRNINLFLEYAKSLLPIKTN